SYRVEPCGSSRIAAKGIRRPGGFAGWKAVLDGGRIGHSGRWVGRPGLSRSPEDAYGKGLTMLQRVVGRARRLGALGGCTAAAALVAATGAGAGAATAVNVACGDSAGLVAAVVTVNAAGGGTINLAAGCTYPLTTRNNTAMGGNGLPVVTSPVTI